MMREWAVDHAAFGLFVYAQRETKRRLSMREAGEEAGVSAACFARAENRRTISAANFLALCLWMDANPFWFLVDPKTGERVTDAPPAPAMAETT